MNLTDSFIITKDNCPYCVHAKALLKQKAVAVQEVKIGRDITREEVLETFPQIRTLPIIKINGEYIGGFKELEQYFNLKLEEE